MGRQRTQQPGSAPPKLPQNAAAHKEHAELCILCQVARDQNTVTVLNIENGDCPALLCILCQVARDQKTVTVLNIR